MDAHAIEAFYDGLPEEQRAVAMYLRGLILDAHPAVREVLRYRIPFFDCHHWFCYLNPLKDGTMDLCFLQGGRMADPEGLLQSRDRKMIRSAVVRSPDDPPAEAVLGLVLEALALDAAQPPRPAAGR